MNTIIQYIISIKVHENTQMLFHQTKVNSSLFEMNRHHILHHVFGSLFHSLTQ